MKILLISIGTRGDIEPFLTLGSLLKNRGHQVFGAFPAQFRNLAEDAGIDFLELDKGFLELIEGEDGQLAMGGKGAWWNKVGAMIRLYKKSISVNKILFDQQAEFVEQLQPNRIVYGGKATFPIIWSTQELNKAIMLSPVPCLIHPVKAYPHLGFKGKYGAFLNKLTYRLANWGLIKHVTSSSKAYRKEHGISDKAVRQTIFNNKFIYAISPSIFPEQEDWPDHAKIMGYHERDKGSQWQPPKELEAFIAKHPKIVLITFGSMTNPEPEKKTKIILDILQKHQIPAIINTASGGLKEPENYLKGLVYFVDRIPYDWAFPKMYAVIHHGGSGTTHTTLKYGCAAMIIPHIIDQFLWNVLMKDLAVGPKGQAVSKLSFRKMEENLLDLWENPKYKSKAETISKAMLAEDFEDAICEYVVED